MAHIHTTERLAPSVIRIRLCVDCSLPALSNRALRCPPCRKIRERARIKAFWKTPKGRATRKRARIGWLSRQGREINKRHNLNYYRRLRAEGKLCNGTNGRVRYLRKHIEHIRAYRAFLKTLPQPARKIKAKAPRPVTAPRAVLAYPFIARPRSDHAELIAVNSLVPRGIPGREDICQNIIVAILEGRTTVAELARDKRALSAFIGKHNRESFEQGGRAVSLNEPRRDGRSWHDVLPADPEQQWGAL